jgi:hypothetical protein
MARIGINALYLIPGGVGGTEIYLRRLLAALACIDRENEYFVFTNQETAADLVPHQPNFQAVAQAVRARFRPARILWEQTVLPRPFSPRAHVSPFFTICNTNVIPNIFDGSICLSGGCCYGLRLIGRGG